MLNTNYGHKEMAKIKNPISNNPKNELEQTGLLALINSLMQKILKLITEFAQDLGLVSPDLSKNQSDKKKAELDKMVSNLVTKALAESGNDLAPVLKDVKSKESSGRRSAVVIFDKKKKK